MNRLTALTILVVLNVVTAYNNCAEWKRYNPIIDSGEYLVANGQGEMHAVFCEFYDNYGYMFIPRNMYVDVNIDYLNPSTSEVLVRHRRTNQSDYDTVLTQIAAYASTPLVIQYNESVGYKAPRNELTLGPYLYLGFLPAAIADSQTIQGYNANGNEYTFQNCDGNGNSYMAFYFDPNNGTTDGYEATCCYTPLMRFWADEGIDASLTLPSVYFFQTEMHMGGCGGYALSGYDTLADIEGVALGMRFDFLI